MTTLNIQPNQLAVKSFLNEFDKGIPAPKGAHEKYAELFKRQRYLVLRNLVHPSFTDLLRRYAMARVSGGKMRLDDEACPGTPSAYGDAVMDELLFRLIPSTEFYTGLGLYPTYSYFRVYRSGDQLPRHSDRRACEISLTLNLGYSAQAAWPIFLDTSAGPVSVSLEPGDSVLYRGIELFHWREPFVGDHSVQVFLHYVEQWGPNAQERFDRRAKLNRMADAIENGVLDSHP
jgi:hypothetical protein